MYILIILRCFDATYLDYYIYHKFQHKNPLESTMTLSTKKKKILSLCILLFPNGSIDGKSGAEGQLTL